MVDIMKMIQPSINVRYCIEVKRDFHNPDSDWVEIGCSTKLQAAVDDIEKEREMYPNQEYRLTRCEWTVID